MAMTSALSRLGVVAHKGAWNNFPQCFDALPEGSDAIHSNAVIVLGGWMLQPPKDLADGIAPAPDRTTFGPYYFSFHVPSP